MVTVDLFEFRGRLLIPTLAQTSDGFYIMVEPVIVISEPTADRLVVALREAQDRGNPRIPTPPPGKFPPPIVLPYAGVKTLPAFEKRARSWGIRISTERIAVIPYTRAPRGGYVAAHEGETEFTGAASIRMAAEWLTIQISGS
jgi:hypothetical protein